MRYDINEINPEKAAQLASRARCIVCFQCQSCENAWLYGLALPSLHAYTIFKLKLTASLEQHHGYSYCIYDAARVSLWTTALYGY